MTRSRGNSGRAGRAARLLGAVGLLLCAAVTAWPQEAAPAVAAAPEKKPTKVQIKHADQLYYDAATKIYHLTGNVAMTHEDTTLYADQCDYDDAHNTARCTGHLKIQDTESTLTGDLVTADFTPKLIQLTGNVTIVTQKKPTEGEGSSDESQGLAEYRQKQTTITCPQIDYYYAEDKKQATVAGPLKGVQEDKTVYADGAFYDGVNDLVTLEGNVRVVTESGSEFRCPKATISLKDDWIKAENVEGVAVTEEETTTPETTPAPETSPPPASSTPPAAPPTTEGPPPPPSGE